MSKFITIRVFVVAVITAMTGCGGGGGSTGNGPGGVVAASPSVPPSDLSVSTMPNAIIDAKSADALVGLTTTAVNSLIKTSIMEGVLTNLWPENNNGSAVCGSSLGYVSWVGSEVAVIGKTSKGVATYSNCGVSATGVGSINGSVNVAYVAYNNAQDFAVNMTGISLTGAEYAQYSTSPFSFTGEYAFNQSAAKSPIYVVATGTAFGKQRIIGQPLLQYISQNTPRIQFDGNAPTLFSPSQVIVRSNININGNWVELRFGKWDVDVIVDPLTSVKRIVPASTCSPCTLTITAANGGQAIVQVTQSGSAQFMTITPSGGGAATTVPITF